MMKLTPGAATELEGGTVGSIVARDGLRISTLDSDKANNHHSTPP